MGKLKRNQRKIVGQYCTSANVQNGAPKKVQVYTKSAANGEKVKGAIAAAYPSYKYYKSENTDTNTVGHVLGLIFTAGVSNVVQAASNTWKNFSVECDSRENAQKLVTEIGDCIEEYGYTEPEQPATTTGGGSGPDPAATETPDTPEKESPDWTTYIIIGLAAVAIVLLVWPKKKK